MTEIINPEVRCTRCILPSGLQGITFDEDGVCSYCRTYEKDFKDWDAIAERRKAEFEALIDANYPLEVIPVLPAEFADAATIHVSDSVSILAEPAE